METIVLTLEKFVPIFMLVVARTMALTIQAPFLGTASVPGMVRVAIALSLAFFYLLGNPNLPAEIPTTFLPYALLLIQEFMVGVLFGFTASIILLAIQFGGQIIDVQIGLSMVMQFNPQTKQQSTVMGKVFYQFALVVLISSYAHLFMLRAYFKTFEIMPIGTFHFGSNMAMNELIKISGELFDLGVQLALPVIIVVFVVDFGLGMMNRVAPQINILELNFAMKPTTGALLITVIMATLLSQMHDYSFKMAVNAQNVITAAAEGRRWQQQNENRKFVGEQRQQGVPEGFPIFKGLPDRGPAQSTETESSN